MVTIKLCLDDIQNVNYYIQTRNEISQKQIIRDYCAARCIQRWVRGHISRNYLKSLHDSAIVIQKYWRVVLARKYFRKLLKIRLKENSLRYYNYNATLIQKTWRGHRVRRMTLNFYQFKEYLRTINVANEKILNEMNQYSQSVYHEERQKYEKEISKKNEKMLQKLHHMLRTTIRPGVFSLYNTCELSELEKLIASVKLPKAKSLKSDIKKQHVPKIGKLFQGPFLTYEEVVHRKNYVSQPSLQASEPYRTEKQKMKIISLRDSGECYENFNNR